MDPWFADEVKKALCDHIDAIVPCQEAASHSEKNGVCIPQKGYQRGAGRGSLNNQGLVLFLLQDGSYIPLDVALREEYKDLVVRDVPGLCETGDTVTLRFSWPGYPPQDFQLRTIDWCASPNKVPLSKVATEVAKVVRKFLKKMEDLTIAPEEAQWEIGPNGVRLEDLRLAALEQVSAGSWQARLFYKPAN